MNIWLRITNKSPIAITIDRIIIDIWVGQPFTTGLFLSRFKVKPKETKNDTYIKVFLSGKQKEVLEKYISNGILNTDITFNYLTVYCESKLGAFEKTYYQLTYRSTGVGGI